MVSTIYDLNEIMKNSAKSQLCWSELDLKSRLDPVKKLSLILKERANELRFSWLMKWESLLTKELEK